MAAQLDERRRRLVAGERAIGWKVGFGSAPAKRQLRIPAPLIGFLTDRSLLEPSSCPQISGWTAPVAEPEIAVTMGTELAGGGGRNDAAAAIASIAPAIELADVDPPPADVEAILAGNIFHRSLVLGPSRPFSDTQRLGATVVSSARGTEKVERPEELTGDLAGVVRHVADLLGDLGPGLRAGEIVICGSIVPPIAVGDGDRIEYELDTAGSLVIRFEA